MMNDGHLHVNLTLNEADTGGYRRPDLEPSQGLFDLLLPWNHFGLLKRPHPDSAGGGHQTIQARE
jgi:hypothetical protein